MWEVCFMQFSILGGGVSPYHLMERILTSKVNGYAESMESRWRRRPFPSYCVSSFLLNYIKQIKLNPCCSEMFKNPSAVHSGLTETLSHVPDWHEAVNHNCFLPFWGRSKHKKENKWWQSKCVMCTHTTRRRCISAQGRQRLWRHNLCLGHSLSAWAHMNHQNPPLPLGNLCHIISNTHR